MSCVEVGEIRTLNTNVANPLYDAISEDATIKEGRLMETAEELTEYITRKCLECSSGCRSGAGDGIRACPGCR